MMEGEGVGEQEEDAEPRSGWQGQELLLGRNSGVSRDSEQLTLISDP